MGTLKAQLTPAFDQTGRGFLLGAVPRAASGSHNEATPTAALAASPGSRSRESRVTTHYLMAGQAALQQSEAGSSNLAPLEKFQVFCTRGFHYIVGSDKAESAFRVLKLSRHGGPELEAFEDATIYSKAQCSALLSQIHAGNLLHKGLQLVCEVSTILSPILSCCMQGRAHTSHLQYTVWCAAA